MKYSTVSKWRRERERERRRGREKDRGRGTVRICVCVSCLCCAVLLVTYSCVLLGVVELFQCYTNTHTCTALVLYLPALSICHDDKRAFRILYKKS